MPRTTKPTPDIAPVEQAGTITIPFAALEQTLALGGNKIAQMIVDNLHGELTLIVVGGDMPIHKPGDRFHRCNLQYTTNDEGAPVLSNVTWPGKDA